VLGRFAALNVTLEKSKINDKINDKSNGKSNGESNGEINYPTSAKNGQIWGTRPTRSQCVMFVLAQRSCPSVREGNRR
jgi:hypothetical protein